MVVVGRKVCSKVAPTIGPSLILNIFCAAAVGVVFNVWLPLVSVLAGVVLVAYTGIIGVAAAEIDTAPPQQVVRFGDLNLRDSRGIAAVYGRLVWAARHVCAGADSADYWVRQSAKPCIAQSVSRAIDSIGAPALLRTSSSSAGTHSPINEMSTMMKAGTYTPNAADCAKRSSSSVKR